MASDAPTFHEGARLSLDHPFASRPVKRRASASSSSSTSSCLSEATHPLSSESDSGEDEAVFFGSHQPGETALVAKLSSTISTPTRPLVRKRDSREFLRRKTLLLSARKANTSAAASEKKDDAEKEWSGGFYVKGARPRTVELADDSDDEIKTSRMAFRDVGSPAAGENDHCDLTFDFANFRLHDAASPLVQLSTLAYPVRRGSDEDTDPDSASEEDDESYGDSDKENNEALVSPVSVRSDRLPLEERPEFLVALGKGTEVFEQADDDELHELNMGGLRLVDFSDPESANGEGSSFGDGLVDLGFSSGEEEALNDVMVDECEVDFADLAVAAHTAEESDKTEEDVEIGDAHVGLDSSPALNVHPEVLDGLKTAAMASTPTASPFATDAENYTPPSVDADASPSVPTVVPMPTAPLLARSAHSPSASNSDLDSPLPVVRAPAVIPHLPPHLARSIRAESGSPYRALPPSISHDMPDEARDDTTLALATLAGSPATPSTSRNFTSQTRESFSTPSLQRSAIQPNSVGGQAKTALPFRAPASAGPSKTLSRSVNAEKKVAARVGKIKSQLDTVFVNRLGPPQRSASGASSTSSSTSASIQARPLGMSSSVSAPSRASRPTEPKHNETARSGSTSTSSRPAPPANPVPNTIRGTKAPLAASGSFRQKSVTVPKPFAASASTAARQPLAPRMAPPAAQPVRHSKVLGKPTLVRPGPIVGRQVAATVSGPATLSPTHATTNPLKRPLPTDQPTLGRAVMSTTLTHPVVRPASSLPARAVRSAPSVGVATFAPTPVFHPGVEEVNVIKTTLKSPPHLGMLRPGETPRKLGTPMKLYTPGRARTAATPLGVSRPNASSPTRSSAALLLGTPGRPTRIGRGGEAIHPAPVTRPQTVLEGILSPIEEPSRPLGSSMSVAQDVKEHPRPAPLHEEPSTASAPERGSSVEYADVSFALAPKSSSPSGPEPAREASTESTTPPGSPTLAKRHKALSPKKSSPRKKTHSSESTAAQPGPRRPKRSIKPPTASLKSTTTPKAHAAPASDSAPVISEKELRAATQRNTDKNTVYLYCTIDRQIVRQPGPRPPSPTSKIRTTADRDEEEKKAGRGERAKRRSARESNGTDRNGSLDNGFDGSKSNVERVERARGPGDDDDYETPMRPNKKIKTEHERRVAWDRELVIIRDDGRPQVQRQGSGHAAKSALRADQVELDRFGNVVHAPNGAGKEAVKKQKIPVTAVFYEGEDPMPFEPAYITFNQEKAKPTSKGRKK